MQYLEKMSDPKEWAKRKRRRAFLLGSHFSAWCRQQDPVALAKRAAIAGCGEPVGELRSGPYDRSGADDTMGVGNLPRGAPPTRLSDGPHLCVGWPPSVPVEELLP